ncbi:CaiB/BaiF CoA transferase family protein [Gymnodinialimonas ceratoperidinii]|uniref:CoA transferase n=1 Tax=Gymnodinialimonas ceratoperidinii TaxID=2856823 RepID=A0A8F6TZ52_9RHOB|nr:CoA transferase [Gymnodinialimonas ceratoperidinii]QXT40664.1 CoA transferase [Gymnodinialimonas ceratoperidinii]
MTAPLHGIRVLDLTNVLAGPFACHQLAHLGAEVIKVENPRGGDLARNLGASPELSAKGMGISFLAQNAGKKSLALNLKHAAGAEALRALVRSADVLVENFRPGVMERLGLGYQSLREDNPALIYCAISGYGQDGPWAANPAYDQIIQGASGVMSITGTDAPTRVGYPLSDTIGGLTAAMAINAALNATPRGTFIDVSMLEATLATMGWVVSNHLIGGATPKAHGNENPTSAPSGTFQAQDAPLNIAANKDEQWQALARLLGRDGLLSDPRFTTREDRKANRHALRAELEVTLTSRPAAHWVEALNAAGIPAGPVLSVPEILDHPQITDRNLVARFDAVPGLTHGIDVVTAGFQLDAARPGVATPPPQLGQDTDAILTELGYSPDDIARLVREGTVANMT